jgi:hypothetical protein
MSYALCLPKKPWRLLSTIFTTVIILSFISPFAIKPVAASAPPNPIYPPYNAFTNPETDPPYGLPSFTWSSVPGATMYRIQMDTEIGFNYPLVLDEQTHNLSYSPKSVYHLVSDGELFWRVRVEQPAPVSEWSNTMRFTKTWATPTNKPEPIAPSNGEILSFFDAPTFSWTPVMGASWYRFQIATSPEGFDLPTLSVDTISTSHQPNNRLTNGLYYWRVIPVDIQSHLGTASDIQSFTESYGTALTDMVPTLISPPDESLPTFTPTFHWTAIEGAEHYRLEYTSDETCDFSLGTAIETRQTFYTPTDTFPNDFRYCWHVRVESGPGVGDWSQTWHFQKRWNLKPVLLTPTNLYQTGLYPIFSWTPVPGAARYQIQISQNPSFSPIYEESYTSNTTYAHQSNYQGTSHYWWRVRPIDGGGEFGVASDVSEYQSVYTSTAPIQISPLYYYPPNNYPGFSMNPYEDRTDAYPIFLWHRLLNPAPVGGNAAVGYRIQVDTNPYFSSVDWQYDTENTSATPIINDNFTPAAGQDYFWRVCPLNYMGGNCLTNPQSGLIWWSQIWKARFDNSLGLQPTAGIAPELLRPKSGQESVEATPLLEWWPLEGATQYQVEVSREESFLTYEISETVDIPSYSPKLSLAQRSLGRTDYGSFYWRVRGLTTDGWSDWSNPWRFQVASQSEWRYYRNLGSVENQLIIGDDPSEDADIMYDLTSLYATQSNGYWYLGFDAYITTTNMTYVFYLDQDNIDGSGAVLPPERDYAVSTIPAHQPEYAIYVDVVNAAINSSNTWVYAWNGYSWGYGQRFIDIGGSVYYFDGYAELKIPNGAIGMTQDTSSTSVMLFSVDPTNGTVQDTVPSDPSVPGNAVLSRFSAVSERMNLVFPQSTVTGDTSTLTSVLPFFWDWPTGSGASTPFAGSILQVDLDEDYSPPHEASFTITSNTSHFAENNVSIPQDIVGDNIYYWRVQPRYAYPGTPDAWGAWTSGWSFKRLGVTAQNLQTSVSFATPSFRWDMAEGAETYRLQVATDPNFGNRVIDITTPMNSYTPTDTLAQGLYYWRVMVNRFQNINNDWSEVEQFTLQLPAPSGLTPDDALVNYAPTFCWNPVVGYDNEEPVLTAWKYRVQVSKDPNFGTQWDLIDTYNNCWTPTTGYQDGAYYWHVAMMDGNQRMGYYSPTASFTKQYPVTTLISPISGSVPSTPTFIWTPVDGAALYIFEVSNFPTFSPLLESQDTISTQYTPTMIYELNKTYYWRVAIRDRYGFQGPFTDATIIIGQTKFQYMPIINK